MLNIVERLVALRATKKKRWGYPRRLLGLFGIGLTVFLLFIGYLQASGNFHEIIRGEFYRSAQLFAEDIRQAHKKYNIQTIINLRGKSLGARWYKGERDTAKDLGITHIDYDMDSDELYTKEEILSLIEILRHAKKPLLVHCKSGADRAGLVSALYVGGIAGASEAETEQQLSIRYGHFSLWFIGEYNLDRTLQMIKPHFTFTDS